MNLQLMTALRAGNAALPEVADDTAVELRWQRLAGEDFFCLEDSHRMPEFFMSLVSSDDHWMFLSSRGALTAGRRSADEAIFPYLPADKLSDSRASAGPLTLIRAGRFGLEPVLWEPFSSLAFPETNRRQRICKSLLGNSIWLEETHEDLGLLFRYGWSFSPRFGFVRTSELCNLSGEAVAIEILDGLRNILPHGISQAFQLRFSNLADAYKKCELDLISRLAVFYLSSIPTDLAEPSEGLRATVGWHIGLRNPTLLLSDRQLERFRRVGKVEPEMDLRGQRGNLFAVQSLLLPPQSQLSEAWPEAGFRWQTIVDTGLDQADLIDLIELKSQAADGLAAAVEQDIETGNERLKQIVSSADGQQTGRDQLRTGRHLANSLFNVMRGGLPLTGYKVQASRFASHVAAVNREVHWRHLNFLESLPPWLGISELREAAAQLQDPDILRIACAYLPLGFSRRHGDPTRPWNSFSIVLKDSEGQSRLNYEGNWRDIFQNWEALAWSFPELFPAMILRFVNASTADGYNPYRLSSEGFEWEVPDESDPWSNIGYWGDHQIVYLSRLLEAGLRIDPEKLEAWLGQDLCVFAQIPYRLASYAEIRQHPRETVQYDWNEAQRIEARAAKLGAEGKLLTASGGELARANLAEKLILPVLAKLANFVPEGGIWLTTQRPEWNDANNALAGYGLSLVTTAYLRRYCQVLEQWFSCAGEGNWSFNSEVLAWLEETRKVLRESVELLAGKLTDRERRRVTDGLGQAACRYRKGLYQQGLSGQRTALAVHSLREFLGEVRAWLDHTLVFSRRDDGLFHSYNLLEYKPEQATDRVLPLGEMLEGQVAALSSGCLEANEVLELLDALRSSRLYRADQGSYLLGADRELPRFLEKNCLPASALAESELLQKLLQDGDRSIVKSDQAGGQHFNGSFRNARDLSQALEKLRSRSGYAPLVDRDSPKLFETFESVFCHREFTGRSGTFFGYEGLGSVYWHMVSKLLLAVQENLIAFAKNGACRKTTGRIWAHYREIRKGLGLNKSPLHYGAFPTDPYSHTPRHAGAQQPGMTGQVKEDILVRLGEVGVRLEQGILSFDPWLFEREELVDTETVFEGHDCNNRKLAIPLCKGSFAFSICQVPVIYRCDAEAGMVIWQANGSRTRQPDCQLTAEDSRSVLRRDGRIVRIEVSLPAPTAPILHVE